MLISKPPIMNSGKLKIASYLMLIALFFSACAEEDTGDPNIPGSDRDKFTGNWLCKETSGGTTTTFTISIEKHGAEDTLYVYNFSNIGQQDYAIWLVSGNSVTIPTQTVAQIDFVGPGGTYSNDEINLSYTSDGESVTAECTPN